MIADDDVRYTAASLDAVVRALDDADLVVPQNVFPRDGQPWHVRWDGARSLLNRAIGSDFPGTLAIRRSAFLRPAGLRRRRLVREPRADAHDRGAVAGSPCGGTWRSCDCRRRPGGSSEQRVRQAYDEFARPGRMVASLAIAPVAVAAMTRYPVGARHPRGRRRSALAEFGRRRDGGTEMFPVCDVGLFAPLWLAERAVCSWLAVGTRVVRGGVHYRGTDPQSVGDVDARASGASRDGTA